MKTYSMSGGIAPFILNISRIWRSVVNLTPGPLDPLMSIECADGQPRSPSGLEETEEMKRKTFAQMGE